ncbi:protein-methionine-sulfoxide reductase catalytic subunit MsrP [Teredinibacter turnerae]|uniref:protein-methionine-sulfoxide reductase catalytic subunit MsrP n=1 Tax=Teredinibacter turnerae TaxID=2426 RepID=UPI00036BD262|nr:protein-methionine-sulfoxide reductase catalytic subunit MsrP [Teredinibacter turnerae]
MARNPHIIQPPRWAVPENQVTDERLFLNRRKFLTQSTLLATAAYLPILASAKVGDLADRLVSAKKTVSNSEKLTRFEDVTGYNNFYELGTDKGDPAANAAALRTDPWSISVEGECQNPGKLTFEDLIAGQTMEERIYKLRCVEAWSMIIPWSGFPLASLLKKFEPTSDAKFVSFETLYDKSRPLPGQRRNVIDWPYREGLRMDEAMHPLTFVAVGFYGKPLPNQNGAPLRLVVPWKYGFKSIKSIVKIRFTRDQPQTSWNMLAPQEYGFYSNVNPKVDHPRWSQKRERRIGELFRVRTEMFNGYAPEVAELYKGMDLQKYF